MVVTSLESRTRGDVNGDVKKIMNDAISVSPWMTWYILKCVTRRQMQKISNNQLIDKEETETDNSEH